MVGSALVGRRPRAAGGGWIVAARLQPHPVNAVTSTISVLAAHGAGYRWVMTLALLAVGACDVATGLALRPAAAPGRLILIADGIAGLLVAANPEPARGGSLTHGFWATIGFIALAAWPVAGRRWGTSVPFGLRPAVSAAATGVLLGLLVWFGTELIARGGQIGLAERILTEAQAVWPLVVVLTCWRIPPAWAPPPQARRPWTSGTQFRGRRDRERGAGSDRGCSALRALAGAIVSAAPPLWRGSPAGLGSRRLRSSRTGL
jgi:Protein of unknown function (DUF998)